MRTNRGMLVLAAMAGMLLIGGCTAAHSDPGAPLSCSATASAWENVAEGGWKDFPPEKTLDGDLDKLSSWRAEAEGPDHGQWIQYDLGTVRTVTQLKVAFLGGETRVYRIDIAASRDGNSWTTLFSGETAPGTTGFETFDVPDTEARYVRLTGYGNRAVSGDNRFPKWINVVEVEIWCAIP